MWAFRTKVRIYKNGGETLNHELVMLRSIPYCKKAIKNLEKRSRNIALGSFSTETWRNGTWGQALAVAEVSLEKDRYLHLFALIKTALEEMPKGYCALLVAVYLKNVSKEQIANKYNVSVATVYRKLNKARQCFADKLHKLGCTSEWFLCNYGDVHWVGNLVGSQQCGGRIAL